jgi:hypothetical protein
MNITEISPFFVCLLLALSSSFTALPLATAYKQEGVPTFFWIFGALKGGALVLAYLTFVYLASAMAGATGNIDDVIDARDFFIKGVGGAGALVAIFAPTAGAVVLNRTNADLERISLPSLQSTAVTFGLLAGVSYTLSIIIFASAY